MHRVRAAFFLTGLLAGPAAATVVGAGAAPAATAPAVGAVEVERARFLMGTSCRVVGVAPDAATALAATEAAFDAIAAVETQLSCWDPASELSWLNRQPAGIDHPVSRELAEALASAIALSRATGGSFDPTVGALVEAWGLRGAGRVPDAAELAAARAVTGAGLVAVDRARGTVRVAAPGVVIDSGGFGKGLALDRAAAAMRAAGATGGLLDFGGQLLAVGAPADGRAWRVALADPRDRDRPAVVLELASGSVATSAQGERFAVVDGRRLGHVLDPRTGRPVDTVASATAWAPTAFEADALSTALLVAGRGGAARVLSARPAAGALWLAPSGDGLVALVTSDLAPRVLGGAPEVRVVAWPAARHRSVPGGDPS